MAFLVIVSWLEVVLLLWSRSVHGRALVAAEAWRGRLLVPGPQPLPWWPRQQHPEVFSVASAAAGEGSLLT